MTPPRLKLLAGSYYLSCLKLYIRNEAAAFYYIDALVQALRPATFVLQNHGAGVDGFADWYEEKRTAMRGDPLLRELVEARNRSEKEGLVITGFGPRTIVRRHASGRWTVEAAAPTISIEGVALAEPVAAFESAIDSVDQVVEEAHSLGLIAVPEKRASMSLEFVRERENGDWEPFDP